MAETFCYTVDPGCGPKGRPKQAIRDTERFDSPEAFNVRTGRGRKTKTKTKGANPGRLPTGGAERGAGWSWVRRVELGWRVVADWRGRRGRNEPQAGNRELGRSGEVVDLRSWEEMPRIQGGTREEPGRTQELGGSTLEATNVSASTAVLGWLL